MAAQVLSRITARVWLFAFLSAVGMSFAKVTGQEVVLFLVFVAGIAAGGKSTADPSNWCWDCSIVAASMCWPFCLALWPALWSWFA